MKKQSKNSKKINLIKSLPIIMLAVLIVSLFAIVFHTPSFESDNPVKNHTVLYEEGMFYTYEINKYPTSVEISDIDERNLSVGFSLETSSLNFGVVPTGGNMGKRFLTLKNTQDSKAKMMFVVYGGISPLIKFNDNEFYLLPEVLKDIEIVLETKQDTMVGNYSGEINIVVKRSKYEFLEWLL
ncbi:MAG: hypothetical protein K0B07_00030 [DPANN group archaeon]|nr:hypothetical protein [DPANN group archaeon]